MASITASTAWGMDASTAGVHCSAKCQYILGLYSDKQNIFILRQGHARRSTEF